MASAGWPTPVTVLIEIDVDGHRSGVAPGGDELLAVDDWRLSKLEDLVLHGVMLVVCYGVDRRSYPPHGLAHWLTLSLDHVGRGMLLVTQGGHVLHANRLARCALSGSSQALAK